MKNIPCITTVARPQDVEAWLSLCYRARGQPLPADLSDQIQLFLASPPHIAHNRFLCWLGHEPIASWAFHILEDVVELRDFFILESYLATHAVQILEQIVALARQYGKVLTISSYSPAYCALLMDSGFKQNSRIMMTRSLQTYQIEIAKIPAGVYLRHPRPNDEEAVAEMIYKNYLGTVDHDMVCSSKAQAKVMTHDIFGNEYCLFDLDSSFLAEDEQQRLIGTVFAGNMSTPETERLMQIVDISISPEWRRKGLGRALLIHSLNAARIKGYTAMRLIVTVGNDSAIELYRSCGFRESGEVMYEAILKLDV